MEKEINYLDFNNFIKEIEGKNIDEIKVIINNIDGFWKDPTNLQIFSEVDGLLDSINGLQKNIVSIYSYLKREKVFLKELELFTNLFDIPQFDGLDSYNIYLEKALKEENIKVQMFYEIVEEGLQIQKEQVLNELYETFKTNIPSIEELQGLETGLQDLFAKESPEKLKLIDSILAYNDPTIKQIKNIIDIESLNNNIQK